MLRQTYKGGKMTEEKKTNIHEVLGFIQRKLKAPKNQKNNFGGYKYRSCEDILEAVKPLLPDGYSLTITDEIAGFADRVYVKSTARFADGESAVMATAYAREPQDRKGMDLAQVTGATSSYARKYALNGLLLIDDAKDPDTDEHTKEVQKPEPKKAKPAPKKTTNSL